MPQRSSATDSAMPLDQSMPQIHVNGIQRTPTDLIHTGSMTSTQHKWQRSELEQFDAVNHPAADPKDFLNQVRKSLRSRPATVGSKVFWPPKAIDDLLDQHTVHRLVDSLPGLGREWRDRVYYGTEDSKSDGYNQVNGYRRVLALLLMLEKEEYLCEFMERKLNDSALPLERSNEVFLYLNDSATDLFCDMYQWRFTVPFFSYFPQFGQVCELDLCENSVHPWEYLEADQVLPGNSSFPSRTNPSLPTSAWSRISLHEGAGLRGGFGEVNKIIIHPSRHEYNDILEKWSPEKNVFALKTLRTKDQNVFQKEVDMLKRFGGRHGQIVSLLATVVTHKANKPDYCLLFPWADTDLSRLWRQYKGPPTDPKVVVWMAEQCFGIVGAVASIHDPHPALHVEGRRVFGRHGDIKPQNVLCFRPSAGASPFTEVLVLSDMGLADTHGDASRSNVIGAGLPGTPNYRPPECDMEIDKVLKQGFVSRAYDIWTLGCLFLEFVIWALDGWKGVEKFQSSRCADMYLGGGYIDIYYHIERSSAGDFGQFTVKEQVYEVLNSLHGHKHCTKFLHEFLDLITTKMLCVQSRDRSSASALLAEMKELKAKVTSTDADCVYSKQGRPRPMSFGVPPISANAKLRKGLRR